MSEATHQPARVWLRISGRVQGVGFRYSAIDEARRLGVTGWVRNTHDGAVELLAEGGREQLQRLATWCHAGPRGALVTDVEARWLEYRGEFDAFRIQR
ncbi:MAG TPA: acylphosphatase [Candidatus Margulisiibacteriota bacterium]|nr:acylphosphatase [Candidatus Margulisiibacteriota bacterium]